MELNSVLEWPIGKRGNIMVDQVEVFGRFMIGQEVPFGHSVAFQHVGSWNHRMVLYDVQKTGVKMGSAWLVDFASNLGPLGVRNPNKCDLGYAHDVLCGLGGFSVACDHLSIEVVSAVDTNSLAVEAFGLNHDTPVVAANIELPSTVHRMHELQIAKDAETLFVPVVLEYLGVRSFHLPPASWTYATFLQWMGVPDFQSLVDETACVIVPEHKLVPWRTIIVQLAAEDLAFELSLRLSGLGFDQSSSLGTGLQLSKSMICTGLWHLDQQVRSDLLLSWACLSFPSLVVWLPSFAAAVVEKWPGVMDDHLRVWLTQEQLTVYAIAWESWGWNLVKFFLDTRCLSVTFFEHEHEASCTVSLLASRVKDQAHRAWYQESFQPGDQFGDTGTLCAALSMLEKDLGLPHFVSHALLKTRAERHDDMSQPSSNGSPLPTLQYDAVMPKQLPLRAHVKELIRSHHGLTVRFILDFARALLLSSNRTCNPSQVKVVCTDPAFNLVPFCDFRDFAAGCSPCWIFVLANRHWTLLSCDVDGDTLKVVQYDGMNLTTLSAIAPIIAQVKKDWKVAHVHVSSSWIFPQTRSDSCGTVAMAHFAYLIEAITYEQAMTFEQLHDSLAVCSSLQGFPGPIGFGPEDAAIIQSLEQILPAKGVPDSEVKARAQAAIKAFVHKAIQQALEAKNVWNALKSLGNSKPKPFLWVQHHELQNHIKDRASSKYGAVDIKKPRKQGRTEPIVSKQLDPTSLLLPPGIFTTNCGTALPQLQLEDVQKDARGVAFATAADVQHYLADGKMISTEGLALLLVGPVSENMPVSLPMHTMRVPAIYKGTNEPVLIDCTTIQLGDQAVYRKTSQDVPELAVCPTKVMRVHVFRDLWETEGTWDDIASHPVRQLVKTFPIFRLCKDKDCDQRCALFHPSLEEEGVESGLLDIWAFRWHGHDGSKATPAKAEVLSLYIRIPESSFDTIHLASGSHGFFFEPRNASTPGPDESYVVIWLPQFTLGDVLHRVRTTDHCITVCRLGLKYGIRVQSKHHEEVHQQLCPQKPFVVCAVKAVYRLEPLPAGTQRASLVTTLQTFGWNAKPLQPCKGSQGQAWHVGSDKKPPAIF